jgi:hypothetical protein
MTETLQPILEHGNALPGIRIGKRGNEPRTRMELSDERLTFYYSLRREFFQETPLLVRLEVEMKCLREEGGQEFIGDTASSRAFNSPALSRQTISRSTIGSLFG